MKHSFLPSFLRLSQPQRKQNTRGERQESPQTDVPADKMLHCA